MSLFIVFTLFLTVQANLFDFFQNQFQHHTQEQQSNFEIDSLNSNCGGYLCPDTSACVQEPKLCPCPFPSSQLRCFLPNGNHICISKPGGDVAGNYKDPKSNWKVDAKDDNVRDCGWVSRYYKGVGV